MNTHNKLRMALKVKSIELPQDTGIAFESQMEDLLKDTGRRVKPFMIASL
jgi:hypothetical protein